MTWLRIGPDFVTIEIVARPNSPRRGPLRIEPRGLVIGISSPAENGRANNELIATIAKLAGVTRSAVSILHGAGARLKVMRINTTEPAMIVERLSLLGLDPTKRSQESGERKAKQERFR